MLCVCIGAPGSCKYRERSASDPHIHILSHIHYNCFLWARANLSELETIQRMKSKSLERERLAYMKPTFSIVVRNHVFITGRPAL